MTKYVTYRFHDFAELFGSQMITNMKVLFVRIIWRVAENVRYFGIDDGDFDSIFAAGCCPARHDSRSKASAAAGTDWERDISQALKE